MMMKHEDLDGMEELSARVIIYRHVLDRTKTSLLSHDTNLPYLDQP